MTGVYSVEDLLRLRASPLITRPANLPAIEEWMGSQETAAKRPNTRGKQEDGTLQPEGFQKRPGLDPSLRKSTTDPERLVLGPPRRSFASSSGRPLGKPGATESEELPIERTRNHERTKTGEDLEARFGDRRSGNQGVLNGRLSSRHDQDGAHLRRRTEEEDTDGKPRRDHERLKWGTREGRDDRLPEEAVDGNGNIRQGARRDQGRSRFEQSWFRSDKGADEVHRDTERGSGYRRDRGRDGDWDMPTKNDVDPEWMGSIETTEPAQARTQEDFQRWKERMKAGSGAAETKVESNPMSADNTAFAEEAESFPSAPLTSIISPDTSNSMDKFFARFSEKSTEDRSATKAPAKTRFASIFGPVAEAKSEPTPPPSFPVDNTPPLPPPPPSTAAPDIVTTQAFGNVDADQAGFQRILQMLGTKKETGVDAMKPKTPLYASGLPSHQRNASPDLVALFKQDQPNRQPLPASTSIPPGLERHMDSRSPIGVHTRQTSTPNKDDLLLSLLSQAGLSAKTTQPALQQNNEQRPPPGFFGVSEQNRNGSRPQMPDVDRPMQQRDTGRSIFDDPAISSMSYQDNMRAREGNQRRPTNGTSFDVGYLDSLRENGRQEKPMPVPQNLPPGLHRPPGLGDMPRMPPGWEQQPRIQTQTRTGPPPGLARGMTPGYGATQPPPPMPPMPQQMMMNQGQNAQRTPQRKYTGETSMPSFPPGMGPPPGFLPSGPPPGFHHASEAGAAQNYGRYAMGGNQQPPQQQPQQQPPPNMNRAFMEMYGNGDRGGLRGNTGGVSLPPGFR